MFHSSFFHTSHFLSSPYFTTLSVCVLVSYAMRFLFVLFFVVFLVLFCCGSKFSLFACPFKSTSIFFLCGCRGNSLRRWQQKSNTLCTLKAIVFYPIQMSTFMYVGLKIAVLAVRCCCKDWRGRHWLAYTNHVIDIIQSPLKSHPANLNKHFRHTTRFSLLTERDGVRMPPTYSALLFCSPFQNEEGELAGLAACCSARLMFCSNLAGPKGSYSKCVSGNRLLLFPPSLVPW